MGAQHSTQWFWSDWLGDQAVRRLTPAERGIWIDCLALMAAAAPTGYLCDDRGRPLTHEEIARVCGTTPVEVAKLLASILDKGVASHDRTGRLYNRRMVRDASLSAKRRVNGKAGGAATRLKWQELSGLPKQNADQLPQQRAGPPILKERKKLASLSSEPRAREPVVQRVEPSKSAGSLATALDGSALTRPPITEPAATPPKPPSELTRAELEATFERRRASEAAAAAERTRRVWGRSQPPPPAASNAVEKQEPDTP